MHFLNPFYPAFLPCSHSPTLRLDFALLNWKQYGMLAPIDPNMAIVQSTAEMTYIAAVQLEENHQCKAGDWRDETGLLVNSEGST